MQTKIVCSTACIILSIIFVVTARARKDGDFATCILPYLTNITAETLEVAQLTKETANFLNVTLQDIKSCFEFTGGSGTGESGPGSAAVSACLTYVSAATIPLIQNLTNEYHKVEPTVQKLQTTIKNCLNMPPNVSTPALMRP